MLMKSVLKQRKATSYRGHLVSIGGLTLFSRTSSRRTFNIASYHSPHSLTWRWLLSVTFDGIWRKPSGGVRFGLFIHRGNNGLQYTLALPGVIFHRSQQRPMWFRDLYRGARDREEVLEQKLRQARRELTLMRSTALLRADPESPQ